MIIEIRISADEWFPEKDDRILTYRHMLSVPDKEIFLPKPLVDGMSMFEMAEAMRSDEIRKSFVGALSANIAMSLTNYIVDQMRKQKEIVYKNYDKGQTPIDPKIGRGM